MNYPNFVEGRYDSHDGRFHYSQEEIKLFAMAIGVYPSMIEVQRNGQLGLREAGDKQAQVENPVLSQPS